MPRLEVFAAASIAILHAVILTGQIHPDEVFQTLEPALHKAFGYGFLSWEWTDPSGRSTAEPPIAHWGVRNWLVPTLFAWMLKLASVVGIDSVWGHRTAVALPQLALHAAMLGAVWRFAARRVGSKLARAALWLTALYAPIVWYGGRTLSESFSTAFLMLAFERLDDTADTRWHQAALSGVWLGCATVARYGAAVFVIFVMLWLLVTRRWRTCARIAMGGVAVGIGLGVVDKVTWGGWFHSMVSYVDFNIVQGLSWRYWGKQPATHYLQCAFFAPWAIIGFVLWRWQKKMHAWLWVVPTLGYVVTLHIVPHKEVRFFYPALALLSVAGAPAFIQWVWHRRHGKGLPYVAAALALACNLAFFIFPNPLAAKQKDFMQLQRKASAEATGFLFTSTHWFVTGGSFYSGGNKPWCASPKIGDSCFQDATWRKIYNRAIYARQRPKIPREADAFVLALEAAGFQVIEERDEAVLFAREDSTAVRTHAK